MSTYWWWLLLLLLLILSMLCVVELCKVYWRQTAGTNSVEVLSPTSVSFLYSWPGYENFHIFLKRHALHDRTLQLDALFFISAYSDLKCCLSLLDFTVIRILSHSFRNVSLFTATCRALRLPDVFGPINLCTKTLMSLGNQFLY